MTKFFFFLKSVSRTVTGLAAVLLAGMAQPALAQIQIVVGENSDAIPVTVTGSTPDLDALMKKAFSIHGAFVNSPAKPDYSFKFDLTGANAVRVTVNSLKVGGVKVAPYDAAGATWREAAYRAGDYVVEKLTNNPGFFAGKLAFVSKRTGATEIWISDILGQEAANVTNDKADARYPHWSPDGAKIIYTGYYRTGFPDLVLVDLTTRPPSRRSFESFSGTNTGGVFSPDGQHVAMTLSSSGNAELYVSDANGKNIKRLTQTKGLEVSPTWSPDGTRIAVSSDPQGTPLLYEVSISGGAIANLPTQRNYSAEPSWNPRYKDLIAFMAASGSSFDLALYDARTRKAQWLTGGAGGTEPCWTNDGRHLIFTKGSGAQAQLWVLDTKTGRSAGLTTKGASQASFVYPQK